jgi:hypothetical protein
VESQLLEVVVGLMSDVAKNVASCTSMTELRDVRFDRGQRR